MTDGSGAVVQSEDLKERLVKAQARKAAAAEAREIAAQGDLEAQVMRAEQAAIDEEALAELTRKHGEPGVKWDFLRNRLGAVAVTLSDSVAFKKFQDMAEKPSTKDFLDLVGPCVLYPLPREKFYQIVDAQPGVLTHAFELVCKLAGVRQGELAGK